MDKTALKRAVAGALRSTIAAHGPVTAELIGSATKRIVGQIEAPTPPQEGHSTGVSIMPIAETPRITIDAAGYVAGARCGLGHSGNQRLVPADRRRHLYQCCGCGQYYTRDAVVSPTDGENGSGGVIRR